MTLCHGTLKLLTSYKSIKFCVFISGLDWSVNCFWWITLVIYVHVLLCSFLFIYVQYNLVHLKKLLGKIFFFNYSFSEVFFFKCLYCCSENKKCIFRCLKKKKPQMKKFCQMSWFSVSWNSKYFVEKKKRVVQEKKKDKLLQLVIWTFTL